MTNDELLDSDFTMDFGTPPVSPKNFVKNELEICKIPPKIHKCTCGKKKVIPKDGNSYEQLVLDTAFNQGAHCVAFTAMKLSGNVADFKVLNILLNQAMITDSKKVVPLPKFLPLLEGFCKGFLTLNPPCENHTFSHYLQVFEDNKFTKLFSEMSHQLMLTAQGVLPDFCQRQKNRKKSSPEFSLECAEFVEKIEVVQEKNSRKFGELPPAQRLMYLFSAFSVLVEILQRDFEVWIQCLSSSTTPSKFYRPLIVHLLWKDIRRFDADAILNNLVSKIFRFYNDCVHTQVSPKHTKVVGRFINLIAEVVDVIGRHQEAKPEEGFNLAADFKNLHYQPKLENGFRGFALKEIGNGRRKVSKLPLYHMDETTAIGNICKRFADAFATALKRCSCKDVRVCQVLDQAFVFIKPPWLRFLISCNLLKQETGVPFLKATAREALVDGGTLVIQKQRLRLILFTSTLDTLLMLGYGRPGKYIQSISKQIKVDPADNRADDIEELIVLIKSQKMEIDQVFGQL